MPARTPIARVGSPTGFSLATSDPTTAGRQKAKAGRSRAGNSCGGPWPLALHRRHLRRLHAHVLHLQRLHLRDRLGLTLLFIAHDLSVVRYVSTRVAVMYLGRIVEIAPTAAVFGHARHPYTQGLLLAAPDIDPEHVSTYVAMRGEPPSPLKPPSGCAFHTRCYLATDRCRTEAPLLQDLAGGHHVACHYQETAIGPVAWEARQRSLERT